MENKVFHRYRDIPIKQTKLNKWIKKKFRISNNRYKDKIFTSTI